MTLEQDLTRTRRRLRDVETEEERLETEAWMAIPGFFVLGILSVILMIATGSDVFAILMLIGFGWLSKIAFFGGQQDLENRKAGILAEINHLNDGIRRQNQRRRKAKQKENKLEKRKQDLDYAKSLLEEGGIDNLNRAIGIFEKYGK
jgi:hypothetical protein